MLGRKKTKRIGIYGGVFNPPTDAHSYVPQYLMEYTKLFDEIWVMPCGDHRKKKDILDWKYRVAMCELVFTRQENVYVSTFDCIHESDGSTIDLIDLLRFCGPAYHDYTMIVGQDNADNFSSWKEWDQLRDTVKFVVLPRGDKKVTKYDWYSMKPHTFIKDFPKHDLSSTSIRQTYATLHSKTNICEPEFKAELENHLYENINTHVIDYIDAHKFYRNEKVKS
jgi:nicotinate-nucleotide adenylyltransferase